MPKFIYAFDTQRQELPPIEYPETIDVIKSTVDEDGHEIFVVVDKINRYKEIQSYKDSCDLHQIISRYLQGDETVLQRAQGQYLDARDFPKSQQEMYEAAFAVERAYQALPDETRAKYKDLYEYVVDQVKEAEKKKVEQPVEQKEVNENAGNA